MPDGELAAAAGQLIKVKHAGCYHAARKREQRAATELTIPPGYPDCGKSGGRAVALKATEAIEELERIVDEFGDAGLVMPDPIEAAFRNPVDRIEFDSAQQAILLVTDR